jgi:hypothetical protein
MDSGRIHRADVHLLAFPSSSHYADFLGAAIIAVPLLHTFAKIINILGRVQRITG